MRPADNIEKHVKNNKLHVCSSSQMDEKVLGDSFDAMEQALQKNQAENRPDIWRNIMRSRISKLAVAAIIIIAVLIGINQFGGSVNITSVAFAEIKEAMKTVPWMHQVSKGFQNGVEGVAEQWIGFNDKIHAGKWGDGKVTFWAIKDNKRYSYDPANGKIKIDSTTEDSFPLSLSSPVALFESMNKTLKEQGAEIVTKAGKYNGKKAIIQDMSLSGEGLSSQSVRLYIEPDSKRLLCAEVEGKDADGNIIMGGTATFSYPENGPKDIYDLGVPRDCEIIYSNEETVAALPIVDSPEFWPEPEELVRAYWKARIAKDYDKMAIMWPGSESWNREVIKDEIPVEYVFGESFEVEDNVIYVPYASKSYFAKHGKYNLKMVLTNKKSCKGRYYITSGN